eukprot:10366953-Alexandrium_andersonii.AAC.1
MPPEMLASASFSMGLLRWSPWPPPGQGALHVQHFPAARAVGRNCRCGGVAASTRVRRPVGPFPVAWA